MQPEGLACGDVHRDTALVRLTVNDPSMVRFYCMLPRWHGEGMRSPVSFMWLAINLYHRAAKSLKEGKPDVAGFDFDRG